MLRQELSVALDLVVDAVYQGGRTGNAGDDPFPRLLSVSNQGGFRYRGSLARLELESVLVAFEDRVQLDFVAVPGGDADTALHVRDVDGRVRGNGRAPYVNRGVRGI